MSTAVEEDLPPIDWDKALAWVADFRARYAGTVYALRAGDFIKIGFTKGDVLDRVSALQTGCPTPLSVMGTAPGGRHAEAGLHGVLRDFRAHGEWFRAEPIVQDIINSFFKTLRQWECQK